MKGCSPQYLAFWKIYGVPVPAVKPRTVRRLELIPKVGLGQPHDLSLRDQDCAPGDDSSILHVIIADDLKACFHRAPGLVVGDLPGLHVGAEVGLPVFESDGDRAGLSGAPEKV